MSFSLTHSQIVAMVSLRSRYLRRQELPSDGMQRLGGEGC